MFVYLLAYLILNETCGPSIITDTCTFIWRSNVQCLCAFYEVAVTLREKFPLLTEFVLTMKKQSEGHPLDGLTMREIYGKVQGACGNHLLPSHCI